MRCSRFAVETFLLFASIIAAVQTLYARFSLLNGWLRMQQFDKMLHKKPYQKFYQIHNPFVKYFLLLKKPDCRALGDRKNKKQICLCKPQVKQSGFLSFAFHSNNSCHIFKSLSRFRVTNFPPFFLIA